MSIRKTCVWLFISLFMAAGLSAQVGQTGSIRGLVLDDESVPLPGVNVTVSSPSLMGTQTAVTNADGQFRIPSLPPGNYTVALDLQGFAGVNRTDIILRVGMTVSLEFIMRPETLSEELTVTAASPVVDTVATKMVENITKETLEQVPMNRSVWSAIQIAPGTVERTVHGSARNDAGFSVDGVVANAPDQNYGEVQLSWDVIEEVEFITGNAGAEAFNAIGGFINVVTRSGGNEFSGSAQAYYTNEDMAQVILPDEDLEALGVGKPTFAKYDYDLSASLGGPIIKDKIWFLGNYRTMDLERYGNFRPTTILGKRYEQYDWKYKQWFGFLKLSTRLADNLRAFGMISYHDQHRPNINNSWNVTREANNDHRTGAYTGTANVNWIFDANTFVDARFGFWRFNYDGTPPEEDVIGGPAFSDGYTGYRWGYPFAFGYTRKRVQQGSVKLTRFQDDFLGGDHEFKAGVEFDVSSSAWGFYRENPLAWTYYDGNPYYYRGLYGLDGPHPEYGDGRISLATYGPNKFDQAKEAEKNRFSIFAQDAFSIGNRLTINFGLRYDTIQSRMPEISKEAAAGELAQAIGETYFTPEYGFNPFGRIQYEAWEDAFPYSFLGTNIGLNYDVFGDGKTSLKASFGRYAEGLPTWLFNGVHPLGATRFSFNWLDLNQNGQPDAPPVDEYDWTGGGNPRAMVDTSGFENAIDPDVKIPFVNEYHLKIDHELVQNLRVSAGYIRKDRLNLMSDPYYDLDTETYWNTADSEYWVPFNTTIPAYNDMPATDVTMYFLRADHPDFYNRVTNIDEAEAVYEALEFTFDKRMSNGWQLGGSVLVSRNEGNYPLAGGQVGGKFVTPNYSINQYGDLPFSRPLQIKLFGAFHLPVGFIASFFYNHASGSPWNRTVTVNPPADWAAANNTLTWSYGINVDAPGTRRNRSTDNLDLRLEKEFNFGKYGTLGIFADIFNVFGNVIINTDGNPGGTWIPAAEGTTEGTFNPGWTGITGSSGTRVFKFSIRYGF